MIFFGRSYWHVPILTVTRCLLQNTFKWQFFSPTARVFFLLCNRILTHNATYLRAVNTETGSRRRRRRGNLVNLHAVHVVHIEQSMSSIFKWDFTPFQEMFFPPPAINQRRTLITTYRLQGRRWDSLLSSDWESVWSVRSAGSAAPSRSKTWDFFLPLCLTTKQTLLIKMHDNTWSTHILMCSHEAAGE